LIARAYKENEAAAGAYDAVTDILGSKTAPKLLVALNQLANEGFPGLAESARSAMQLMDKEVISKLDDFGDRMARIWTAMKSGGADLAGVFFKVGDAIGTITAGIVGLAKGWDISAAGEALNPKKAVESMRKVTTEMEAQKAIAEAEAKADEERRKNQEKMDKENEAAAEKYAKEMKKLADDEDKMNAKRNAAARAAVDAEYKLVQLAMERAKAEGKVTTAFEDQLVSIQKMGGAGQGGFKAGPGGGGEGTTTVAALETVVANSKTALEFAYKNINEEGGDRQLIEAKALVDQSEKNLQKAKNQQGVGSPVEILISGLDFSSLEKVANAALGSREQNSLDRELLSVTKKTGMTTDEINASVKYILGELKG
jgi:hypothetical protein